MCNKNKYLAKEYSETKGRTGTDRARVKDRFLQPRRELPEKRTLNSKTFENEDHTFTTSIYMDPVHYLDTDGTWKDSTDDLAEEPGIPEPAAGIQVLETENREEKAPAGMHEARPCYVNRKGSWKATLLKKAGSSALASISEGDESLAWGLYGAGETEARQENSRLVYDNILPETDLSCLVRGTRVKEDIILKSPKAPGRFPYRYELEGVKPEKEGKAISFRDDTGEEIFVLSAPRMTDASGNTSEDIELELSFSETQDEEDAGGKEKTVCTITVVPDEGWLKDPDRKYPVTVDPVHTTSRNRTDILDAHVDSQLHTTNFRTGIFLKTRGGDVVQRSYMKFGLPGLSPCDTVVEARAYMVSLPTDGNLRTISIHKVIESWEDSTLTWQNMPLFEDVPCDVLSYYCSALKYIWLDVTKAVREWYRSGGNYGLVLKDYTELGPYTEYLAADCDDGYQNLRPHIDIMYVSRAGLSTGCSTHAMSAGRAGTVTVNDYNGNTCVSRSLFATAGSRMPMDISLTWNSCNASVNTGYSLGCRLSVHHNLDPETISGTQYYRHTDGTGSKTWYHYDSEKSQWRDEETGTLVLTINTSSADRYTIKDKDENKLVFDASGKLTKMQDASGNTLTVTYNGIRVTKVTDGAGRAATLTYNTNSSGGLNNLKKITGPGGEEVTLNYTGDHIKQVVDVDGAVSNYTYSGNYVVKAASPYGQAVGIIYDSGSIKKAVKLTEYGTGNVEGNTYTFNYGDCSTTVTDRKGRKETIRFNTLGSPVSAYDGLGRAVSARYLSGDGGSNRLGGSSKMQAPVVQLLKDPLVMLTSGSPWQKTGEGSIAVGSINTNSAYVPYGLGRSLKFVSSATSGYGSWKQSVTVVKGKTYTFSMYVRADITDAGSGSCRLQVQYYDASGSIVTMPGQTITPSTGDFERQMLTFAVPSNATSGTVTCELKLDHVKGTLYGGMAQLEEGDIANRVNLIDNGTFILGSTAGFSGSGTGAIDSVVSAGAPVPLPVYRGLTTLSATPLRAAPSTSGTVVTTTAAGQHLSSHQAVTASGSTWYYAENSIAQRGYIPASAVLAYLGGSKGTKNGRVSANNTILYASASTSASRVLEGIAAGTRLVINSSATSGGTTWYRVGMALGTSWYTGYLPASSVNVLNSSPEESSGAPAAACAALDSHLYKMTGVPGLTKRLVKTFTAGGAKGDAYMVNLWGYGKCLPLTANDAARHFGVRFTFTYTDGQTKEFFTEFGADGTGWQFLGDVYVAEKAYSSLSVSICFDHQAGQAFFDGFSLYRENFSQSYAYNNDGTVKSTTDIRSEAMQFTYSSAKDLTGITDPKGNHFTYTYDNKHRPTKAVSAANVTTLLMYDSYGNVTKQGNADPAATATGTWVTRTMTSDGNHVSTVTSPDGKISRYYWDLVQDRLTSVKDRRNNSVSYEYDTLGRRTKTSMAVESGTVTDEYTYANDRLASVKHNNFLYNFQYDAYGNKSLVKAAGSQIVSYQYEANNGNLLKAVYANGDTVRYAYDSQGRVTDVYGKKGSAAEQQLFAYTYDREGNIATVRDCIINRTWTLQYDLSGRLAQADSSDSLRFRYTYDVNGNLTAFRSAAEATFQTNYTYDNDNRERTAVTFGHTRTTHYDAFGRVTERNWNEGTSSQYKSICYYPGNGNNRSLLPNKVMNGGKAIEYTYDDNGNIKTIKDVTANKTRSYIYDKRNQVTRENDPFFNKTILYTYDLGGNLTTIREYAYTNGTPGSVARTVNIAYGNAWKDQMTSFDGQAITYDACGNMLTRGTKSYTWAQGKQLASVSNGHTIQYQYDHNGLRIQKTVDGVVTDFRLAGSRILSRKEGSTVTYFSYDSAGQLIGMSAGSNRYFYVRNAQNDIIALIDENGTEVVRYEYDAWGNPISTTGTLAGTIGKRNPFRYRGYYWDEETGMYYLESRYYDPEIRRFISADNVVITSLAGTNLYMYCGNNPVNMTDPSGHLFSYLDGSRDPFGLEYGLYDGTAADFHRLEHGQPPIGRRRVDITAKLDRTMHRNGNIIYNYRKNHTFLETFLFFADKERNNGEWDLKRAWNLDPDANYIYHGKVFRYDDIGNIHYGYVGGFITSPLTLLLAGGAVQVKTDKGFKYSGDSFFDDPRDQFMILYGYSLWYQDTTVTVISH